MGYFPFFVDIQDKPCLIVGGGKVAYRKIKKLIEYGPLIKVVSPYICSEIKSLNYGNLFIEARAFCDGDIENNLFVIAATDDEAINSRISFLCSERNILVNVVDSKEECGFLFPSLYKNGELSIGISTGGSSPNLAVYYRNLLETSTPASTGEILDFLNKIRPLAKDKIASEDKRRNFFKECLDICISTGGVMEEKAFKELLNKYSGNDYKKSGFVHIVGAGCSDMDLITVRGLNLVQSADVIIYDDLIADGFLDTAKESCEKIYAGKRGGSHYMKQEEISQLIVDKANEGKTVVRLKGGDPFVFGRGGEEIMALKENNIPFDELPGITSAIAIPAEAGIPITHRGMSRSFHVITGHTKDDLISEDMESIAKLTGTLVFLMGLSNLEKICQSLIKYGKDESTPAAVISGGNSENKVTVRSTLKDIAAKCRCQGVKSPVVIVVGKVAELELK